MFRQFVQLFLGNARDATFAAQPQVAVTVIDNTEDAVFDQTLFARVCRKDAIPEAAKSTSSCPNPHCSFGVVINAQNAVIRQAVLCCVAACVTALQMVQPSR